MEGATGRDTVYVVAFVLLKSAVREISEKGRYRYVEREGGETTHGFRR